MADQQAQVDPNVERIKQLFIPHDPQLTGCIPSSVFGEVLTQSGFNFSPRMQHNLLALIDNGGQVPFGAFMWLWNLLSALSANFQRRAQQGQLPVAQVTEILKEMQYNFADKTYIALQAMADANRTGFVGFEDMAKVLAFIIFSNNLFMAADTSTLLIIRSEALSVALTNFSSDQTQKLTLEQMKSQLPWLGITDVQPGQAEALFAKFDADNSGTMEFDEFVAMALALRFPHLAQLL